MKRRLTALLLVFALIICMAPVLTYAENPDMPGLDSWAEAEVMEADALGLCETLYGLDFSAPITREQFCSLAVTLYEKLTESKLPEGEYTFEDCDDPYVSQAYTIDIIGGYPDGTFRPDALIRRQELALLLTNILEAIEFHMPDDITFEVPEINGEAGFQDIAGVYPSARYAIEYMYSIGAVGGKSVSPPLFAPADNTKVEEAVIIALNVYKAAYPAIAEADYERRMFGSLIFDDMRIAYGDFSDVLFDKLGSPSRIDYSVHDVEWYVYSDDPEEFTMVGVTAGVISRIYSQAAGMTALNGLSIGMTQGEAIAALAAATGVTASVTNGIATAKMQGGDLTVTMYFDVTGSGELYAIYIAGDESGMFGASSALTRDDIADSQAMILFDIINAFRSQKGFDPL